MFSIFRIEPRALKVPPPPLETLVLVRERISKSSSVVPDVLLSVLREVIDERAPVLAAMEEPVEVREAVMSSPEVMASLESEVMKRPVPVVKALLVTARVKLVVLALRIARVEVVVAELSRLRAVTLVAL